MQIEIGFQPNCSETVFRFSHEEISKLGEEKLKEFWRAACNGVTPEDVIENPFASLGLPSRVPHGAEYSSLVAETQDHFTLSYYQGSNEKLVQFAIENLRDWLVEAPFSDKETIPKNHLFEFDPTSNDATLFPMKEFEGEALPIKGWEDIIELKKLANKSLEEKEKSGPVVPPGWPF